VWLKGEVASKAQRDMVLGAISNLEGVKQVVNDLRFPEIVQDVSEEQSYLDSVAVGVGKVSSLLGLDSNDSEGVNAVPVAAKPIPTAPSKLKSSKGQATARVMQSRPKMPAVDDNVIAQEIGKSLTAKKDSGELRAFNVNLSVSGGTVWMKGYASNEGQRAEILASAQMVDGVVQVVNDIVVQAPAMIQVASAPERPHFQPVSQSQHIQQTAAMQAPAAPVQMMQSAQGMARARYEQPNMPNYAWPTYAAYPNYGQVTYPKQYSPSAWPYIGPFYPYPQVPLGWRKVTLEWDDGWWFLDFESN
ncbi:MAG: BON domain-containing protein, partial [Planctomycetota bacterium]|nr:BON domain-containing protein [Planctomycetota bacterium]